MNKTLPVEAQQVSQPLPKRGQNQSTSQLQIIKTRHVKKKQKKTRHGHTHWQIQKTERGDYTFPIINFPFFSSNIPAAPVYGLYISQLLRYSRACAQWVDVDSKQIYETSGCGQYNKS